MSRFNIITMCGSTKFKNEFIESVKWLTLGGNIVISVGLFGHADGDKLTVVEKIRLDELHKGKIDLCDEIFVVNVDGYIGESTKKEIEYALKNGKKTRFLTEEISELNKWKKEYYSRVLEEEWNVAVKLSKEMGN